MLSIEIEKLTTKTQFSPVHCPPFSIPTIPTSNSNIPIQQHKEQSQPTQPQEIKETKKD